MRIYFSSVVISLFIGIFTASGTLLGMNIYEDKNKTEKAETALYEAQLIHDISPVSQVISREKHSNNVSESTHSISRLKDIIPSSEFGKIQGIISIPQRNIKCSLMYGVTEKGLYSNACIHSASYEDSLVILGHNYRSGAIFHPLLYAEPGDEVQINYTDNVTVIYKISDLQHITETDYNQKQDAIIFSSGYDLVLVTCESGLASSGRYVAFCKKIN